MGCQIFDYEMNSLSSAIRTTENILGPINNESKISMVRITL